MQRFFEGHKNIGFDIRAAFSSCFAPAESAESGTSASTAEKCFEEIAEAGAAEFKLHAAAISAVLIKSAAGRLLKSTSPIRWWLKSTWLIPIRAELIVLLALFRIAQDFVRFIDLLKFFFGRFFVLGDVGMIFAGQFPERAFDFVICRGLGNTQRFIIIPELHSHCTVNLVPPTSSRNLLPACMTSGNF